MAMGDLLFLPQKILFDTSIYISRYRNGKHEKRMVQAITQQKIFLSAVVYLELRAGTIVKKEIEELEKLKELFEMKKRFLVPTKEDWSHAAEILSKLGSSHRMDRHQRMTLTHDVLIAISARAQGVTVVTENQKDFGRIRKIRSFSFEVWK